MSVNSIILIIVAYLLGSLSFAIIVSKLMKLKDPRDYGSKNPGATNVLRSGNKIAALMTLLGDALKGWLIIFLSLHYMTTWNLTPLAVAVASIAVLLGHLFPIFFRFKGGKGVATAIGVVFAFSWEIGLIMLGIWFVLIYFTRISSLSSLIVFAMCPFLSVLFVAEPDYQIALALIAVIIILRHRENITKLLHHQESKVGEK